MSDRKNQQEEANEMNDIELEASELIASLDESSNAVESEAELDADDEREEFESEDEAEEEEVEEAPKGPQFVDFPFAQAVKKAVERMGFQKPTDVQLQAIPKVLEGKDVLVTAQTGSGKTAAFLTPILSQMLAAVEEKPARFRRALIIAPTRELAEQIGQVARDLTFFSRRFRYAVVIGGSAYGRQLQQLRDRPAFVIGTPGRLIDHIDRGTLKLDNFDFLVLDEADRMLDMGFEPQIEAIVKALPETRQTMMFSATLPPEVKRLVTRYLKEPVRVSVGAENRAVASIKQEVISVREGDKDAMLLKEIDKVAGTMIIFTRTKMKADRVASLLNEAGHQADALHGDLTQGARRRVTMNFREEKIRILVATDIASRGLDIDHIQHVVNYDLPMVIEDYIHRIGRTGRAGREGHSIAFVTPSDMQKWARICKMQGLPAPRGSGGYSRDRGGRRNDGKFSGPRQQEGRGFRSDRRGPPAFGDRPSFGGGGDSRPSYGDRPQRPAFGDSRPQRSERPSFGDRPQRPAFNREDRGERSERPQRSERPSFGDRPASRSFDRAEGGERPQKRAWSKTGGDRYRDDAHKRQPFKREGDFQPRGERSEGPRTWDTNAGDTRPQREFKPRRDGDSRPSFGGGDTRPQRPAGPKRFAQGGVRKKDENWGKPWNPKGPMKKPAAGGAGQRRDRY